MRPQDGARLLLLATIWGSSFLFIKVALGEMSPVQIVFARLVLGAGVLWAILAVRGRLRSGALEAWRPLLVMAVVANVVPFALITWGEQRISSSLAAVLNSTTPLFTAALAAALVPGERPGPLRVGGILLGFVGVAVIVGVKPDAAELGGELAVVGASLAYATGFVYARRRLTGGHHSPLELSAVQLALASAVVLPLAAWNTL
ncbi:MAG TPA: DMT family transporter, partial [Actinomycetota bacterium]|nr:DMT family transporter [Actinomycetota bacterium]